MTQIATSPTAGVQQAGRSEALPSNPKGALGQEGFLQLMVAQLQAQNPLQPGNDNEYINELANFTELEQVTNLASSSELSGAVQLIGREVSYTDGKGGSHVGTVEGVQRTSAGAVLTISGTPGIELSKVTQVS
jgi:flagellar basal-body rod modification protein FlgD